MQWVFYPSVNIYFDDGGPKLIPNPRARPFSFKYLIVQQGGLQKQAEIAKRHVSRYCRSIIYYLPQIMQKLPWYYLPTQQKMKSKLNDGGLWVYT